MPGGFDVVGFLLRLAVLAGGFAAVGAPLVAVAAGAAVDRRLPQAAALAAAAALIAGRGREGVFSRHVGLLPAGPLGHLGPDAALLVLAGAAAWWLDAETGPPAALMLSAAAVAAVGLGDGLGPLGSVHLLAAAAWAGPLPYLVRRPSATGRAASVAAGAGAVAVLTGAALALGDRGAPPPFATLLAVKTLLVAGMAGAGAATWWLARRGRPAAFPLRVEACLAAGALVAGAALVGLTLIGR